MTLIIKYIGEHQGDQLGLYHLTIDRREERLRQGLVYRQIHDADDGEQCYLYRLETQCTFYILCKYLTKVHTAYFNYKVCSRVQFMDAFETNPLVNSGQPIESSLTSSFALREPIPRNN